MLRKILRKIKIEANQKILDNALAKLRYKIAINKQHRNFGFNPDELALIRVPRSRKQAKMQTRLMGIGKG